MPFPSRFSQQKFQQGQALLVIVLIMVVALTVGLSIATRSLTNTRISTDEENSQRAFSAAEAGVERVLKTSEQSISKSLDNNSSFDTVIQSTGNQSVVLNGGASVTKDEGVDLWLSDYSADKNKIYKNPRKGKFIVRWEGTTSCAAPAIEIVYLSGIDKDSAKATHVVLDSCNARQQSNHFTYIASTSTKIMKDPQQNNVTFQYSYSVNLPETTYIARIIPLYANTKIGISDVSLTTVSAPITTGIPQQGFNITSTGKSGGTARKIAVFQQYPRLPIEVFPYAIFAP